MAVEVTSAPRPAIASAFLRRPPVVVAEIGNNHEGSVDVARQLIREAAAAGADAVKLQTFRTEHYVSRHDTARFARLKSFELPAECYVELAELARSLNMWFLSTPFDLESVDRLEPLVDAYKVASGDNDFTPLLKRILDTGRPVIVSTGASDLAQIADLVALVESRRGHAPQDVALLHCVSAYPAPEEDLNLGAMETLRRTFGLPVGYSDHALGIEAAVLAASLGATIVEKHFTLDKAASDFRDHQLSADPADMRELVRRTRSVVAMTGSGLKDVRPSEAGNAHALRRSIVAVRDLPCGHTLDWSDLTWVRPGGGSPPGTESALLRRRTRRAIAAGDRITGEDLE